MAASSSELPREDAGAEGESVIKIEQLDDADDADDGIVVTAPEAPEREKWGSKLAYMLTLVGYAVGFGNIWRFPYQVRENGGLVFMIPYLIMLGVIGIPLFFLELAVGQRRRKGVVYAWAEISPGLGGIGIACGLLCFLVGMYYNTLLAYCLSYLVDSFRSPLPWASCKVIGESYEQECLYNVSGRATKYYWFRRTLDVSPRFENPGSYNWWLFMYLLIAWSIIFGILLKGTKSVGAVVYFTAAFPYLVLLAFFVGNLAIDPKRAWLGAYRLVKPDWNYLWSPLTWLKAGSQIFFSLGLAEGCLVVFASYNPTRNNCYKDAISISLINCGTSVFAALVVFPIIGLLGHTKYDECVQDMITKLEGSSLKKNLDKKYDIYFFTQAKIWKEVSSAMPITIRYNYGELNDGDPSTLENDKYTVYEKLDKSALSQKYENSADMISLRNCSIGHEATASGGGTGFVFLGFTEAVLNMPGSNFWSVLFFTMLLTLGIDSGFGVVEGFIVTLEDLTHVKRWKATSLACGILTVFAILIFPFGWGIHALDLMDQWTANWTLLGIALLECIAVAWNYGLAKISYDIHLMTGAKPNLYILICWKYLSPIVIILLLLGSIINFIIGAVKGNAIKYKAFQPKAKGSKDGELELPLPGYAVPLGMLLMIACIMWVPIHCLLRKTKYSFLKDQAPAAFPEEELREERSIHVLREEDQFTSAEKALMGSRSIQDLQSHRDKSKTKSQTSIHKRTSSGNISLGKG